MVWSYERDGKRRGCETRLGNGGDGYELVIEESGTTRVERFSRYWALLAREHELLTRWIAEGWAIQAPSEHTRA